MGRKEEGTEAGRGGRKTEHERRLGANGGEPAAAGNQRGTRERCARGERDLGRNESSERFRREREV